MKIPRDRTGVTCRDCGKFFTVSKEKYRSWYTYFCELCMKTKSPKELAREYDHFLELLQIPDENKADKSCVYIPYNRNLQFYIAKVCSELEYVKESIEKKEYGYFIDDKEKKKFYIHGEDGVFVITTEKEMLISMIRAFIGMAKDLNYPTDPDEVEL